MNYIKVTIEKEQYVKVQPSFGKFLCELCPVENEDGTITVAQVLVKEKPTGKEFEDMEKAYTEEALPLEKQSKIEQLSIYDKSSAVNEFTLAGNKMWLKLDKREDLRQSLIALKAKGIEEFTYWNDLTPITLPVSQYEYILNEVEVYALQCFNVTAQHKANIMALTSLAEVEAYDFTTGYPEKLAF